jgi:phospholipid-binding lipoprotein MlaA
MRMIWRRMQSALIILAALVFASCASRQPAPNPPAPHVEDIPEAAQASAKAPLKGLSPWNEAQRSLPLESHDRKPAPEPQTSIRPTAEDPLAGQPPAPHQPSEALGEPPPEDTANDRPPYDPLSPLNEKILSFNVFFDDHVGRPAGMAWGWVVPYQARLHIRNFFRNTAEPKNYVNCMLQRRFHDAGVTAERFSLNSTMGVGGFFDVAQTWFGLERKPTDFGLTAAHHSFKYGPYLMAPAGGPTSLRDAAGGAVDGPLNLLSILAYVVPSLAYLPVTASLGLIAAVNERSLRLESFDDVDRYSVDLYGAVQDGYYQRRSHDQAPPGSSE